LAPRHLKANLVNTLKLAAPAMANAGGERDAGLMYGAIERVVDKMLILVYK